MAILKYAKIAFITKLLFIQELIIEFLNQVCK